VRFWLTFAVQNFKKNIIMLKQYETVIILSPLLSEDELKNATTGYSKWLKKKKAEMVQEESWGLKQLAYPIENKHSGFYLVLEYKAEHKVVNELEVELVRDNDRVLRFQTVLLDKYAIKYNDDKRAGLVGRSKKVTAPKVVEPAVEETKS
jgi:small subunit ribosomal protein S6